MIKIENGNVSWEGDSTQIFAEIFTILDVLVESSAEASNKSVSNTRELLFDSYFKWVASNVKPEDTVVEKGESDE